MYRKIYYIGAEEDPKEIRENGKALISFKEGLKKTHTLDHPTLEHSSAMNMSLIIARDEVNSLTRGISA